MHQPPGASAPDRPDADSDPSAAGGSDGGVNAHAGTDAGPPSLTDANADTGLQTPDAAQPEDPKPVAPALDGLVSTSSRWLLFTEMQCAIVPTELMLIDLNSMQRHLVNPNGTFIAYSSWSPDGRTLLTSGANADSDRELFVVHLTTSGFVPAVPRVASASTVTLHSTPMPTV
jgi:hypothetical protein